MSRWGTILLLLAAMGVAAFLFFFEPHLRPFRASESHRSHLLSLDPLQVRGLRITTGSETTELSRQSDGWFVGPDPVDRADAQRVAEILLAVSEMEIFDSMSASEIKSEKDLRNFGLLDPRNKLEILGDTPTTILFGREAVGNSRVYARVMGNDAVYVVSNPFEDASFLDWQSFRDRRLTPYDASTIDRLVIRRPNGEMEIERSAKGWELKRPLRADADNEKVMALLNTLLGAKIQDFSGDPMSSVVAPDPGTSIQVLFYPDNRDAPESLWIRENTGTNGTVTDVYSPSRKSIFTLDADYFQLASINPEQVRNRRLLPLNLDTVDVIRIDDSIAQTSCIWKRSGDGWIREGSDGTAPASTVTRIVSDLANTEVLKYELASPDAMIRTGLDQATTTIKFDALASENTPEAKAGYHSVLSLKIGSSDTESAFVQVNHSPEICIIPRTALQHFLDWAMESGSKADVTPQEEP